MKLRITSLLVISVLATMGAVPATAGMNAGATAQLSWAADTVQMNLTGDPSSPFRLFIRLEGLVSVRGLGLTVRWMSADSLENYVAFSDTTADGSCGHILHLAPSGGLAGDSTYDWSIDLPSLPPTCVSLMFSPSGITHPTRFCLSEARAEDAYGVLDTIAVLNDVTIGDGTGCACPPSIYSMSPAVVSGAEGTSLALTASALPSTSLYSMPVVSLLGMSMDSLSGFRAVDASGAVDDAVVLQQSRSIVNLSFSSLQGHGPWKLVGTTAHGVLVNVPGLLRTGSGIPAVSFRPLASFRGAWHVPAGPSQAWSPVADMLALLGSDGTYVADAGTGSSVPVRLLQGRARSVAWSPNGSWLAAVVQSSAEQRRGLASLVAVRVGETDSVALVTRADVGPIAWLPNGDIVYWERRTGVMHRLDPPEPCALASPSPLPARGGFAGVFEPQTRRTRFWFVPTTAAAYDTVVVRSTLDGTAFAAAGCWDAMPGGLALAFLLPERGAPTTAVIDRAGRIVHDIGASLGLHATSATPDGRFIIAHRTTDDGGEITAAIEYLTDAAGTWSTPIVGIAAGMNGQFSRTGMLLAYEDPLDGSVHVGLLQIMPR